MSKHLIIVHGYLLCGTGSNIYSCNVAMQWKKQGHAVTVFCQDPDAGSYDWVDEYYGPNSELPVHPPSKGTVRVVVPDIAGLLPVYKYDDYKGYTTKTIHNCTDDEIARHIELTSKGIRKAIEMWSCDKVLANHAILSPVNVKRALEGTDIPFDIKIHGSSLTFIVEENPAKYKPFAVEGIMSCNRVIAGTDHVYSQVRKNFPELDLSQKLVVVPPGMNPDVFNLCMNIKENSLAFLKQCLVRNVCDAKGRVAADIVLPTKGDCTLEFHNQLVCLSQQYNQRVVDADIADRFPDFADDEPILMFFGKFLYTKGIGEIILTFPSLLLKNPKLRLVLVGFGIYREHVEVMLHSLMTGDKDLFQAAAHCVDEDGDRFLESSVNIDEYFRKISPEEYSRVLVTGCLNHFELGLLLPMATVSIVASKAAEAFGMVSVEALSAGVFPLCVNHTGVKDVLLRLRETEPELEKLMNIPVTPGGDFNVSNGAELMKVLPGKVLAALDYIFPSNMSKSDQLANRVLIGKKLRAVAKETWSWDGICKRLAEL